MYDEDYFINKHTNLPFYLPFLDLDCRADIKELMINNTGEGVYTKIGIVAGGICTKKGLCYCPKCVMDDIMSVGEPYFHRIHQIPGVIVCPIHSCVVRQYKITRNDIGRIRFIRLDPKYIDTNIIYEKNTLTNEKLVKISRCASYIINNDLGKLDRKSIVEKYKRMLDDKGLLTLEKRVRQNKLVELFKEYYTAELLMILESNIDSKESNWIRTITRKPKSIIQPIRHILFILFLCNDAETFFAESYQVKSPFGKAPWPCLNPAANHYKELVIDKCRISIDSMTSKPVATFKCDCGFIYSKKINKEEPNDIYKIGRIKIYGDVWEKKLIQLIKDNQYSIREIARIMKCDPKTIIKYSRKLGVGNFINSKMKIIENKVITNRFNYKDQYSKDILQLCCQHSEYSRSQIRKELSKQYAWFYRNDREWLKDNLPAANKCNHNEETINLRVDWNKRDNDILENIKVIHEKLLSSEKQTRITKSIIGRKLGISALLEHHLDKLTNTKKYLSEVLETIENYQIRRVDVVCRDMIEKNIELKKWKIIKAAGLKPNCSLSVMQNIDDYLSKQLESKIV